MVVVVVRVYFVLLQLFVIWNFFINGQKGLAHAQNCLKSAGTVRAVQKCPKNQTEWEVAAQRKNCLEIQKYDSCTDVEYHCLVNEFRNKTIEVCTSPRYLQGYCPHYSSAGTDNPIAVRNDYTKKCVDYSYPCNCSIGYLSTEAYKWQCCYNGTNNNSRGIQNNTDLDQNSDRFLPLWIFLGLLGSLGIILYFGCVIYGIYCRKKPLSEVLCVWRYISCKSLMSSDPRKDEHERNPMLPESNTHETIIQEMETNTIIERHHEDNLNSLPAKEDNSGLERTAALSSREGSSNSDTHASQLTPETNNPNSRTSEVNDPNQEAIASKTPKAANSNSGASEVDGTEPKAIASHLKANLNSGAIQTSTATPDSNKKLVTDSNAPVTQPSDNGSRAGGLNLNLLQMAKDDDTWNTEIKKPNITERVENLKKEMERLLKRLYRIYGGEMEYMEYKTKSVQQKIKNMNTGKKPKTTGKRVDKLKQRVGELEKKLQDKHIQLDGWDRDIGIDQTVHEKPDCPDKPPKTKGKEYPLEFERNEARSHVEDRSEEEIADSDNDQTEDMQKKEEAGAMWRLPVPNFIPMKTKKEKVSVWPEDANRASSHDFQSLNDEEKNFEKKTLREKVETISKDFENLRRKSHELGDIEDTVSEIDTDFNILLKSFRVSDSDETEKAEPSQGMDLDKIVELVQKLRKELDELREKK